MNTRKRLLLGAAGVAAGLGALFAGVAADPYAESSLTKVGEKAPQFTLTTLDGATLDTKSLEGKVVVLNFFATWCGPCRSELPHLEKEVWQKYKDREGFALAVVGREHSKEELEKFRTEQDYTFPYAPDPDRKIYSKFATQFIPRNYVIGPDGNIIFQSIGFNKEEFEQMVQAIHDALEDPA